MQKLKAIEQLKEQATAGKQLEKNQVFSAFLIWAHSHYYLSSFYYKQLFNWVKEHIELKTSFENRMPHIFKYFFKYTAYGSQKDGGDMM